MQTRIHIPTSKMIIVSISKDPASFAPGDSIEGTVEWTELNNKTNRLEIRLIWYTVGKGDVDVGIIDTIKHESPMAEGSEQFSFTAPTRPHSFSGKLISLIWAVEVVEFPSRDGVKETILLSPNGEEIVILDSYPDKSMLGKYKKSLGE